MKKRFSLFLAFISMVTAAHATVSLSGSVLDGTGVFTIDQDITFAIIQTGSAKVFVMRDWAVNTDTYSGSGLVGSLAYSLNDGPDQTLTMGSLFAHGGSDFNDLTSTDTYFYTTSTFAVNVGDTLTIRSGSWNINWSPVFDSEVSGVFSGDLILMTDNGITLSLPGTVPEPSTAMLLGLGLAGMAWRRKSRVTAE